MTLNALAMLLPFALFAAGIAILTVTFYQYGLKEISYIDLMTSAKNVPTAVIQSGDRNNPKLVTDPTNDGDNFYVPAEFPLIYMAEQYATLTCPDAKINAVPVMYGDADTILRKNVGQYPNSRFPGQNGKIIYSAHVTTYFKYLDQVKEGSMVYVDTIYGKYTYKVTSIEVHKVNDADWLEVADGQETLVLYTCHPYGYTRKDNRLVVTCEKVSGYDWINQVEE